MKTATPDQIAIYGHIAVALRSAMANKDINPPRLAKALGTTTTCIHNWLKAFNAPGPMFRPKLSRILGIPEVDLMVRAPLTKEVVTYKPEVYSKLETPVMTFTVNGDGSIRIKVDATLPNETGAPLVRLLLEAGALVGR